MGEPPGNLFAAEPASTCGHFSRVLTMRPHAASWRWWTG